MFFHPINIYRLLKAVKNVIFEEEKIMAETSAPNYPRGVTFEEVWASIQETDRQMKETDRKFELAREENRQMIREMKKETDKLIGDLGNRFGELVEHLIVPNMKEKFNELGFNFDGSLENWKIREPGNPDSLAEIDILLENGDTAVAIEVKSKPKQGDVDEHIRKMGVLRKFADKRGDRRKFLGAIAGAIMDDSVRIYALKNGFYVVEQTGDTVRIVTSEKIKPREW